MTFSLATDFLEFQLTPSESAWSVATRGGTGIGIPHIRMSAAWKASGRRVWWNGSMDSAVDFAADPAPTPLGEARALGLRIPLARERVVIELEWRALVRAPLLLWRASISNQSPHPIEIGRIELFCVGDPGGMEPAEPLHASSPKSSRSSWDWGGRASDFAFYSNGWQSWGYSGTLTAADRFPRTRLGPLAAPMRVNEGTPQPGRKGRFSADLYGVLGSRQARTGVLAGFLSQQRTFGSLEARLDRPDPEMRLWANGDGARLDPGARFESDWACLQFVDLEAADPLGPYVEAVAAENAARAGAPIPVGWCSWYYFFQEVSQGDVYAAAAWAREHRPEVPISLIQIDDGFEAEVGDWFETNARFRDGLAATQRRIRGAGLQPGLWLAPFVAKPGARVLRDHPEWVLRGPSGRPANAGFIWNTRTRALDLSHPGVLEHVERLIRTAREEWGFDYLKLDFLYAGALPGKRHDPTITRAQALHNALAAIRQAAGDASFLVGCGCPIGSGVGIFDAMRISSDVAPRWNPAYLGIEPFFRTEPDFPSARNAIRNILTRAHLHRRWWINDPDCLLLRDGNGVRPNRERSRTSPKGSEQHLTLPEIQSLATAIALSGGSLIVSDNLPELTPGKTAWLARLLPPLPRAARVLDWFDNAYPSRLLLPLEGAAGRWSLVAVINWKDRPEDLEIDLGSGGLGMRAPLHLVDFWRGEYRRLETDRLEPVRVPPHGVLLVALRPVADLPRWIGDTLHVSQGLVVQQWDVRSTSLSAELSAGHRVTGKAFLALPDPPSSINLDGNPVAWREVGEAAYELELTLGARSELRVSWG